MKITKIRFVSVKGTFHYDVPLSEEQLVRPIDIYPEYRAEGTHWHISNLSTKPHYPVS